jgi:ABC-type Fe3+ transport system substrate-binding protein
VLIERLAAEGEATRADLFMAVDAGNLWQAAERGLLAKTAVRRRSMPRYPRPICAIPTGAVVRRSRNVRAPSSIRHRAGEARTVVHI